MSDKKNWIIEAAPEILAILRQLEWSVRNYHLYKCPVCGGLKPPVHNLSYRGGHRQDCPLGKILKKAEEFAGNEKRE